MTISATATAIGLTGPFGSGCSTCAGYLVAIKGYHHVRLSGCIRARWAADHPDEAASREELQALGNSMRQEAVDPGYLAQQALAALEAEVTEHRFLAFDGIRNIGEIETLKEHFGRRFYLLAIDCPTSQRWNRLAHTEYHGLTIEDFNDDDQRDTDQEHAYGQQVQLCVDQADVIVTNDNLVTLTGLQDTVVGYVELLTGERPRYAEPHEILMNLAYSSGHGSKCLKRQVGAVIVNAPPFTMGQIVGQGFNDNPVGTPSCVNEPKYGASIQPPQPGRCYRDIVRQESFEQLIQRKARCPECGQELGGPVSAMPPWNCSNCNTNLEAYFWPERAMSLCTAVHAEVAALLAAGDRAKGATLYTTTFPCFQCAEKLAHAGVQYVVYTEPYPDVRAAARLDIAGVEVARFQGVRSGRFDEIFARARPYVSNQLAIIEARAETTG